MALGKHALIDPALSRGGGLDDLQWSLLTSAVQRVCDSFRDTSYTPIVYIQA